MSKKILISKLNQQTKEIIVNDLTFKDQNNNTLAFDIIDDELYVPFSYGSKYDTIKMKKFPKIDIIFTGKLKPQQKQVRSEVISDLNSKGSSILSANVGFGKTILGINIASKIKLKTLVVVNRVILLDQWKQSVETFTNAKCCILKPNVFKKPGLLDHDIYIINITNIPKIPKELKFGFVIADELHLLISECGIKHLLTLNPKYLLGLSATPYRTDHLNKCIDSFFGTNQICVKLSKNHQVYKITTKFIPDYTLNVMGKIDWNSVLNSQAESDDRNKMITELVFDILKQEPHRNILILVKRISHGNLLKILLEEKQLPVDTLLGNTKYKETDNNILIGTTSKVGTGFDAPKLDTLILACDVQAYFIQQLGRIFRRANNEPKVFDLVDDFGVLKTHYYSRRKVYLETGGTISNYKQDKNRILK